MAGVPRFGYSSMKLHHTKAEGKKKRRTWVKKRVKERGEREGERRENKPHFLKDLELKLILLANSQGTI